MDVCNLETKFGVQSLRDKIYDTRSACFRHNMPNIPGKLEHIKITMDLIEHMCETDDNLLKDVFDALLKAPNNRFNQFFVHKKLLWEDGKHYDFDVLDSAAKKCAMSCALTRHGILLMQRMLRLSPYVRKSML